MKWFIPPTRVTGSKRQTATHEPRSVRMIVGSRVAYTPPTWIATSALPPPDRSPLTDALRAGQHVGVDVRRQDTHVPVNDARQAFEHRERDAVSLLAARASRAPDPEPPGPGARRAACEDLGAQEGEVMRFAEELGLVGREGVDHPDQFFALGVALDEVVVILLEPRVAVVAQTLPQPGADERPLGLVQGDPGLSVDERRELAELAARDDHVGDGEGVRRRGRRHRGDARRPAR